MLPTGQGSNARNIDQQELVAICLLYMIHIDPEINLNVK
jgi:hypothetical protein